MRSFGHRGTEEHLHVHNIKHGITFIVIIDPRTRKSQTRVREKTKSKY